MSSQAALAELVRTVAHSVEELSALVTNMPRIVDERIAQVQQGLGESIRGLYAQMEQLQANVGQFNASISSSFGAFRNEVQDTLQQHQQVIADNRTALQDMIKQVGEEATTQVATMGEQLTEMVKKIDLVDAASVKGLAEVSETLNTTSTSIAERLDSNHALIQQVRTACDTTDLFHGIAKLNAASEQQGTALEQMRQIVETHTAEITQHGEFGQVLAKAIADGESATLQLLETARKRTDEVGSEVEYLRQMQQNTEEQVGKTQAEVAKIAAAMNESIERLLKNVQGVSQRNTEAVEVANRAIAELAEAMPKLEQTLAAKAGETALSLVDRINDVEKAVSSRLEKVEQQVGEDLSARLDVIVQQAQQPLPQLREELQASIKAVGESCTAAVETITSRADTVDENLGAFGLRMDALCESRNEVSGEVRLLQQALPAIRQEIEEHIGKTFDGLHNSITQVSGQLGALGERIKQVETTTASTEKFLGDVVGRMNLVDETLAHHANGITERMVELGAAISTNAKEARGWSQSAQETITALQQAVAAWQAKVDEALPTFAKVEDFDSFKQVLVSKTDAAVQALRELLTNTNREFDTRLSDGLQSLQELRLAVPEMLEKVEETQGALRAEAESRLTQYLERTLDQVRASMEQRFTELPTPPAPVDLVELKTELLTAVDQLAPKIDIRDVGFDAAIGEDQTVVFTFSLGDQQVVREFKLGVGFDYRGVYERDEDYKVGNFVTHKGSMWYAKAKPTGEPGKDIEGWQLAVKCGRDGKDAPVVRSLKAVRDPASGVAKEYQIGYEGDGPTDGNDH